VDGETFDRPQTAGNCHGGRTPPALIATIEPGVAERTTRHTPLDGFHERVARATNRTIGPAKIAPQDRRSAPPLMRER